MAEGPVFRERSRYDKDAEVSACKIRMPDTCAFVLTSHSPSATTGILKTNFQGQKKSRAYSFVLGMINCLFVILFPNCSIHSKQLLPVRLTALYLEYKKHSVKQIYCWTDHRVHIQQLHCLYPYKG